MSGRGPGSHDARPSPWAALFDRVDIAWLVFFRIAFGVLLMQKAYSFLWATTGERWLERSYSFTFPGFHWVQIWPGDGIYIHFYALLILGFFIAIGFLYRLSAFLHGVAFTYIFLLDQTWFINHYYLICLLSFLMALTPAHHALSVDCWLRPSLRSATTPRWTLWLLRVQIGIVYLCGGLAKMNPDWIQGWPLRCWLPGKIPLPYIGSLWNEAWFAIAMSWGGLLLDTLVVPALLWRKTRLFAIAAVGSFHFINSQMFTIGVFPMMGMALTLNFLDPDWPRRVFNWPFPKATRRPEPFAWTRGRRALVVGLSVYLAIQVLVPLRHFLYPGFVAWTEEGHIFAWHMKLRSKRGFAFFHLTDPETDESWFVDPTLELTARQARVMAGWPRLLHRYAHHLADFVEEEGRPRPRVRAITGIRMNCRPELPIVDPTLNLTAEPLRPFGHNPWVLPLHGNEFAENEEWRALTEELARRYPPTAKRELEMGQ